MKFIIPLKIKTSSMLTHIKGLSEGTLKQMYVSLTVFFDHKKAVDEWMKIYASR